MLQQQGSERKFGVRYFTLCGKDGIDIYLFYNEKIILDDCRGFPSVHYCESYPANFVEVKSLLGRTKGTRDTFEKLIRQDSFQAKIRREPFDIINLDFSGVCFPFTDEPFSRTLKSIFQLIELQKGHNFDLFITFRAVRSEDNQEAIIQLSDNMNRNFEEDRNVELMFLNKFNNLSIEELVDSDYGQFLLATFPKIIFGYGSTHSYIVSCPLKYIYMRKNARVPPRGTYQIIKFLFTFDYLNPQGFIDYARIAEKCNEEYKKSIIADLDNEICDVDKIFSQNTQLNNEYRDFCINLLESRKPFGI